MVHTCQEVPNLRKCSWFDFATLWLLSYLSLVHFRPYQSMLTIPAGFVPDVQRLEPPVELFLVFPFATMITLFPGHGSLRKVGFKAGV
jgi:hypothetical protein